MMVKKSVPQYLIDKGLPPSEARIVADMATHARDEAVKALIRVIDSVPDDIKMTTVITACLLVDLKLQEMRRELQEIVEQVD